MGELARAVEGESVTYKEAADFAGKVLDRFRNPSLEHQWTSISVQYSSKMKMRNIPLLLSYYKKFEETPEHMALGMAAYLLVMRGDNPAFTIQDDHAAVLAEAWKTNSVESIAKSVLSNQNLWGTDLSVLNGFEEAVSRYLHLLIKQGAIETIGVLQGAKTMVS
jgi:tagaturonate reductase